MKKTIIGIIAVFLGLGSTVQASGETSDLRSSALGSPDPIIRVHSEKQSFAVIPIIQGLNFPWSLAFLPDEAGYLITQRSGKLLLIRNGHSTEVSGAPEAAAVGQGGLLDLALSPEFIDDHLVYMSFAEEKNGLYGTAIARGKLSIPPANGKPHLEDLEIIYRALPKSRTIQHFGSRLIFDERGYLYVTLGDRGKMSRAQDIADPYGSVLRLNSDGTIPPDNPFASDGISPGAGDGAIWSYGHRNAQGLAGHPLSGDIWLHEHGPKGGDELNIVIRGANYGWPKVTYGVNYDGSIISTQTTARGIENPITYWVPSIAPSGLTFYQGEPFSNWQGDIFLGALAGRHLRRLELQGNQVVHQEVLLLSQLGRIRDVRSGPDGLLYLLTDDAKGGLYQLRPLDAIE